MKVLVKIFIVLFVFSACSESNKKFNVSDYTELKDNNLNIISLVGNETVKGNIQTQLLKKGKKDNLTVPFDMDILYYRFYLGENGNVDSVESMHNEGKQLNVDESNIRIMKNWKFTLSEEIPLRFDFVFTKNEIEDNVYNKIVVSDDIVSLNKKYTDTISKFPEIVGGVQALAALIKYPSVAKESGVEGSVFVRTFINEEGNVEKLMVTRGIGSGCDIAAVTAISKTKFIPAMVEGKPVKVQVLIPIKFRFSDK